MKRIPTHLVLPAAISMLAAWIFALAAPPQLAAEVGETESVEAAYQFSIAKMLAEEGSYERSLEAYERSLELEPSALYVRLELAKLRLLLAQISRNRTARQEQLDAAAELLAEARRQAPENGDVLRADGQVQLQLTDRDPEAVGRAAAAFESLRRNGEADLQVLSSLGQIYLWQGRPELAAEVLQEAANALPGHRTINAALLQALVQSNQFDRAAVVLRRMVELEPDSVEHRMQLAEILGRLGDHRAAVAALRAAPDDVRSLPEVRQRLAGELHMAGEDKAALVEIDTLLSASSDDEGLRRLRVQVLSALLRYDEAIDELRRLAGGSKDADSIDVDLVLSRLLERAGRSAEAIGVLETSLARQRGEQDALRLRLALVGVLERSDRNAEAIEILAEEVERAAAASPPANLALLARSLSEALQRAGRMAEAMSVLERAADRLATEGEGPTAERLRLRRWAVLAEEERWQELAAGLAPVASQASGELRLGALLLHAEALAELGRLDEALVGLEVADADPALARQLAAKRAELLLRHGRAEEGRQTAEVLASDGDLDSLLGVAQIYQRTERWDDALPLLLRALEAEPDSVRILFALGSAYERAGRFDDAAGAFERVLELEPDQAAALNYLGYMWAERGENLERATEMIERAVAIDPDNGAYVDSLGWAYHRLGRSQEAARLLEWSARLIPEDSTIFDHLGDVYRALDRLDDARAAYRRALELEAEKNDEIRKKLQALGPEGG